MDIISHWPCLSWSVFLWMSQPLPLLFLLVSSGEAPQLDLEGPGLGGLTSDEAAMAVIMSLLETDANLDFGEMHWSL